MRENALFHVISITQTSPGQSVGSSHVNAKCKPGSPNTLAQQLKSFKDHLRAAFPPSTPGATLCEKTKGFVRFLTSKHHLDAAIPLRSALTALQIILQLRRPPLYSVTPLLSPSTISTLSISNLPSSLLSPSLLVVIIYCLGY